MRADWGSTAQLEALEGKNVPTSAAGSSKRGITKEKTAKFHLTNGLNSPSLGKGESPRGSKHPKMKKGTSDPARPIGDARPCETIYSKEPDCT